MRSFKVLFFLGIYILLQINANNAFSKVIEIAITIDDLPVHGAILPGVSRRYIMDKVIATLRKHDIKEVYGFMNGQLGDTGSKGHELLKLWVQSGNLLANHTYSHLNLSKVNTNDYIKDIQRNENILNELMTGKNFKYFRYPYLAQGNSSEKYRQVKQFLLQNNYKIAEVTVNFSDYEWNSPYVRCMKLNNQQALQWLNQSYLESAMQAIKTAEIISQNNFHRDIKNILLIHLNLYNAVMLDSLLTLMKKKEIHFISLDDALTDPVYKIDPEDLQRRYFFTVKNLPNSVKYAIQLRERSVIKKLHNLCRTNTWT